MGERLKIYSMKVVILAAGRGSRMQGETAEKPKCLVKFKGKSLIEHTIGNLLNHFDYDDIFVVSGYRSELLSNFGVESLFNPNWETTNIMGSLMMASEILQSHDTLVVYSDIFFEDSAIQLAVRGSTPSILSLSSWRSVWDMRFEDPLADLENFKSKNGVVTLIGGKAQSLEEIEGQFSGIYSLDPDSWKILQSIPNLHHLDTTTALNLAIKEGVKFSEIAYPGFWAEFDSISDLISQDKS